MSDTDNKPTEEMVKASNAVEEAKWQGDFEDEDLVVPYKREESDAGDESKESGKVDKSADKDEAKSSDNEQEDAPVIQNDEPEPIVTVQDPGEYSPQDYSFEVTDKDGKKVKIGSVEEADAFAEDDDNFTTAKALKDFMLKSQKMESKLEADYEKWKSQEEEFTKQSEMEAERQETVSNMSAEFDYLVSKKLLPEITKELKDADWNDPEVAKQPGVKEQLELIKYMVKKNEVRIKAGIKPLSSVVDAFNSWQLDFGKIEAAKAERAAGEARKTAGARVAGVSPTQTGAYVPKGISVGDPNKLRSRAAVWDD